ncbi:hypothetical protein EVAR_27912_1 [Eumeta japonica]|uniref:Uncharacterized protein n=1 Tax=Eumeta variegata TaxID=151549 RepID=A0A4C1UVI0_EUMVA|nr:hypothetical protein EVAR_27912_1 [Eumeta japonica]
MPVTYGRTDGPTHDETIRSDFAIFARNPKKGIDFAAIGIRNEIVICGDRVCVRAIKGVKERRRAASAGCGRPRNLWG